MDSYVKTITLDVNADQNYTIVKAKQGDKINRKIAITLKKDGANFTPTGVSEIWFRVEKPDKNIAIVKSTDSGNPISVSGNVYTVSLSEQCLTASGKAWCDLAFLDSSGNILSSCAFIMNIIPMPNGNTAESTSEWTELQKAIDDAERFADIVAFRTSGNYIQYTVDGQTWTNLVNVGAIGGDLQTQINERMLLAPDYTGATDLDSLCNYIKSLITNNESKYRQKIFAFNCTRESGAATGYFGTSSFSVICKYSSVNYGYGIMMSDDEKSIASFRTNNSTNYLYEIGDLKGSLNTLSNKEPYDISKPGVYTLTAIICAGYTTASGNYVDFYLPIRIDPSLQLSATYVKNSAARGNTTVFTPTTRISATDSMADNIAIPGRTDYGLTFEIGFLSTQTAGLPVTVFVNTITITAT